ncbi:acylneuraminate cytidylyltransferase family protein [bacterium]|nr:acylneuraminate cytidylyltransferase family protein [bacterium]
MNILITICARGGSKGVPDKNIILLGGEPLIAMSIKVGQRFADIHQADMAISTEDPRIREVAETFGLSGDYERSESLAGDAIGKVDVIRDLLFYTEKQKGIRYDFVLDLDVSSPLRSLQDLQAAFEAFQNNTDAMTLFSVNTAHRNPYFNMVEAAPNEMVTLSKRPPEVILSRQATPLVYDLNASFYFYRREFFDLQQKGVILDNQSMVFVMDHICFDVDSPLDLTIMRFLVEGGHLDFELT